MEFVYNQGFNEVFDMATIPEEHKAIVRERIKTTNLDELISWN